MRYILTQFTILVIGVAAVSTVTAGDPKQLTRACPQLLPIDGVPVGKIVINNKTVLEMAKKGRFAAVTNHKTPTAEPPNPKSSSEAAKKKKWRSEHRRAVKAVHDMRLRLSQAENEHEALKSRFFSASKESQRIRLRPQLDSKAFQVSQLKQELKGSLDMFSRTIREARLEGAQPGWFRDLPRP